MRSISKFLIGSLLSITLVLLGSRNSEAEVFSWPVMHPTHHVSVSVGYGYFSPFGPYSPWAYPYNLVGYYPYGFEFPVFYAPSYGAIAYSPSTNQSGFSHTASTLSDAIDTAKSFCAADDCRPVVWASGGCAALAIGQSKLDPAQVYIGWSYHYSRYQAASHAVRACRQGGDNCRTHTWMCTP